MKDNKHCVVEQVIADENAMLSMGQAIADAMNLEACTIYLHGELGAGKTTLTKGIMIGLGVKGNIKSPTYTLVESYPVSNDPGHLKQEQLKTKSDLNVIAYHFDLYRLADPEELEYIGIRDYDAENSILIIEWPERGRGYLPSADLQITIEYLLQQRKLSITSTSERGETMLNNIAVSAN